MKKTTKLLTVLVAFAMIFSSFAMLATNKVHVHAAEPTVGTEFKLGTVGTDNVNGDFTVYMIERVKPDTWDGFNASAPFKYADMKAPVIEGGAYVDKYHNDPKNQDITDTMTTSATGEINTQVRPGICKVLVFKAPVAGTYTVSADVKTYYAAAAFVSVGTDDLELVKQFAHAADDTLNYTVELKAGETFNIGLSRASGSNNANVDPFSDRVAFTAKNFKVTLDAVDGEITAGHKFNLVGKNKNDAFSFGIIEGNLETSGFKAFADSANTDGINSDLGNTGVGTMYYTGTQPAKFGWGNPECSGMVFVNNEGAVHGYASGFNAKVIKFVAPVDGTYTMSASSVSFSGAYVATAVNDNAYVKNSAHKGNPASPDTLIYNETFELKAGQAYYVAFSRTSSGDAGDIVTFRLNDFVITLDALADESVETVVYDINEYFGKTDSAPFSFHNYNTDSFELGSAIAPITGTGDNGTGYANDAWTSYQPVKYNQITRVDSNENSNRPKGTIWGVVAGNATTAILFTAPADGNYSYQMTATRWWNNNEQYGGSAETQPSAVTVKHGDVVETAKMETGKLSNYVKGTATLKAGETILFYVDSLKNGAGDDYTLNTLKVTTTKAAPEEEVCDHADAEWTTTATKHSKTCDCGEVVVAETAHVFGNDNVCDECSYKCTTVYSINKETWGTVDTMGNFKFYYGSDWNNVGATLNAPKNLVLNANGVQLDTADGKKVFYKIGDSACINLPDQSFISIIIFTAPVNGEYTYNFNYHKWGTSDSIWVDGGVKGDFGWDSDFVTANDTAKIRTKTVNLKAGDKLYFFLRCQAGLGVTVNDLSVALNGHSACAGNCVEAGVCEKCGTVCGEIDKNNHKSDEIVWSKTEDKHSAKYACCGEVYIAEADHTFNAENVCEVCGFEAPETPCTEHKGGTATCTKKAVCSECGAEYGELAAHKYSEATCTAKAKCSACGGETGELAPHKYSEATCTAKAKCSVCGGETGELKAHNYKDGFCTECDDEDPNYVPPTNPPTGDKSLSIALLIAALGLLGMAFVPSKRR